MVKYYHFLSSTFFSRSMTVVPTGHCASNALPTKAYRNFWTDVNGQITIVICHCLPVVYH